MIYENDWRGKEGCKANGPGNETGRKESETAPVIPEEGCTKTTVEAIFRVVSPKSFFVWAMIDAAEGEIFGGTWRDQLLLIQIAELQMPIGIPASGLAYVLPYPSARRDFCIQASRRWHISIQDWNHQRHPHFSTTPIAPDFSPLFCHFESHRWFSFALNAFWYLTHHQISGLPIYPSHMIGPGTFSRSDL
jgi:hypothetical protein